MAAFNANIAARLAEQALRHPDRCALIETAPRRRTLSFGELATRTAAVAAGLASRGVRPGDAVLLFLPMSIELYTALLAILHLGAVVVFVDPWAGRARLDAGVAAAQPRAFLGTPKAQLLRLRSRAIRAIPIQLVIDRRGRSFDRLARAANAMPACAREPQDHALVTYTTGSTGQPKAVARSHGFLWTQHEVLARHLDLRAGEVDLPTLPIFVLNNLALGVTTLLADFDSRRLAKLKPARIHAQLLREGVTTSTGSPAFYARLLEWYESQAETLPLRHLYTGGAPIWPAFLQRLQAKVSGQVSVLYGSSEAEPISRIDAAELLDAASSPEALAGGICVGRPIAELALRLIRPQDGPVELIAWPELEVAAGEVGEVVVAGAHVVREYWNDAASTQREKIQDGTLRWHRTGDGARLDAKGRLWLMGRLSQRVRRAGRVHWSTAAELRALSLPQVAHAAYFGLTDATLGERAILCLERPGQEPLAPQTVRDALGATPVDTIFELDRIPRDPRHQSKTDLAALRKRLGISDTTA